MANGFMTENRIERLNSDTRECLDNSVTKHFIAVISIIIICIYRAMHCFNALPGVNEIAIQIVVR